MIRRANGRALCSPVLILAFLFSACATMFTPRTQHASSTATTIPNMPMLGWGIESCGAGSLATVLQHYGDPTSMKEWDASLPKMHGGVLITDLLVAARKRGFDAQLVTGDRALIENELRAGRPVILMLKVVDALGRHYDFFHYIVADGIDPDRNLIRTQFGDRQARWVKFERLENAWAGGGHAAILIKRGDVDDSMRAAVALEDAGKYADAAAKYRYILTQHPDSSLAWTNLGNAESQLGHTKEAEDAYRHALPSRDAMNNLAWLLYQQKRLSEAETFARQAAAQNGPDSYLVLDTLARILAAKGDCAGATSTFKQAIDSVPASHPNERAQIETGMAEAARACKLSS
jgi:tetratricopeptide (TPR) repeat protein